MVKSYQYWIAIAGVTTAVVAGSVFLTHSNQAQNPTPQPTQTVLASVWDEETEFYSGNVNMTVYRSPSCGCCGEWIKHAKKHGFQITDITTEDMDAIKKEHNIPPDLASCHTTIINGYVMEGHIPVDDIKRFLKQNPDMAGLTVPGMPLGTPGMESGDIQQPFEILALGHNGEVETFKRYDQY